MAIDPSARAVQALASRENFAEFVEGQCAALYSLLESEANQGILTGDKAVAFIHRVAELKKLIKTLDKQAARALDQ